MSTATITSVPTGTWTTDAVHSTFGFSVRYMGVSSFRGTLADFDATLTATEDGTAQLAATGRVASVVTADENLNGHLQSPDFFDSERHPEVRYRSSAIHRDGDAVTVEGELTLKGVTRPVALTGTLVGPVVTLGDLEKIGLELEAEIDRTEFGLSWNAPLPGGGLAVGDRVTLSAQLAMVRS